MEELLFLGIISIILLGINLYLNRFDMWSPSSLFYMFWIIAIFSSMYMINIYEFKINLLFILIVLTGWISFFIGYNLIKGQNIDNVELLNNDFLKPRNVYFTNISLFVIVFILGLIAIQYNVSQIGMVMTNEMAESNEALNAYRHAYLENEIEAPFYIRQINRFLIILAYFSLFDLANRFILKKHMINMFLNAFILMIVFINTILQSSRSNIVYLIISLFVYINIFYIRKNRTRLSNKITVRIFIIAGIGLLFFGILGSFMGRPGQDEPLMVICRYFSTGIMGLNHVCSIDHFYNSKMFGEATFSGIWRCINDYVVDIGYNYEQEFSFYNGYSLGNTYTGFYRYYSDFGGIGVIIIPLCIGYIFSRFYNNIINKKSNFIYILLFGYFIKGLVLFSYDELLISTQISFGLISDIIYIFIIKNIFFKKIR